MFPRISAALTKALQIIFTQVTALSGHPPSCLKSQTAVTNYAVTREAADSAMILLATTPL